LSTDFKFSKELIQLRRDKVLELIAQAIPQNEIAQKLGVSPATISLDLQYLRETAKANIQNHIEERIPMQFEECQAGLKLILRKTYDIVDNKSKRTEEQLAAMNLAVNIYGKLMDLSTNGAILEKTLKWLEDRKKILPTAEEQKQIDKILGETSTEDNVEREEDLQEQEEE
jgi:glycine betaine/choline ABC-type transport system substrate-binding protein